MKVSADRLSLVQTYSAEFEEKYLLQPKGQHHLSVYMKEKEEVTRYWAEAKQCQDQEQDLTDFVLTKLLPYSNTKHNREKGYRISIAPTITRDLKSWFENAGWQSSHSWKDVANALFEMFFQVIEKRNYEALREFQEKAELSKGFRSGFISPTLACFGEEFRIINRKTIDTVNFIFDSSVIDNSLANYMANVATIDQMIEDLANPLLLDPRVLDMFCHWMCDKRLGGYARTHTSEEEQEGSAEPDGTPSFESDIEPTNHWEAVSYIVRVGNLLGYKTYVADASKHAFDQKLGDLATLKEVPAILKSAPQIERIDVIWYSTRPPFYLFEVEDGGTMREALHRLYNATAFDARFVIVSPAENAAKFQKWVTTAPFKEFEDRYQFRTYDELFYFYRKARDYTQIKEKFLSC